MSLTQVEIGPSYSFTDVPSVRAMCRHIAKGSRGGLVSAGFVDISATLEACRSSTNASNCLRTPTQGCSSFPAAATSSS